MKQLWTTKIWYDPDIFRCPFNILRLAFITEKRSIEGKEEEKGGGVGLSQLAFMGIAERFLQSSLLYSLHIDTGIHLSDKHMILVSSSHRLKRKKGKTVQKETTGNKMDTIQLWNCHSEQLLLLYSAAAADIVWLMQIPCV
ncbi:hypothetical protein ACJX0J_035416 [Zea mays]